MKAYKCPAILFKYRKSFPTCKPDSASGLQTRAAETNVHDAPGLGTQIEQALANLFSSRTRATSNAKISVELPFSNIHDTAFRRAKTTPFPQNDPLHFSLPFSMGSFVNTLRIDW